MSGILSGLRIVEASAFVAMPYAGLVLAEMGADVIRIDPVAGGLDAQRWPLAPSGQSLYWGGLNKGKKSILLDVRQPRGREIAHQLMTKPGDNAGIVISNLPARGWLDFDVLKALRSDLIMINLLGNRDGSVALDYTVNAAAGFPLAQAPKAHDRPVNSLLPAWDLIAGMSASNGVLAAERHRRNTGEGQFIQLALSDVAFHGMSALGFTAEVEVNKDKRPQVGNSVYGTFSYDFVTKDMRRVVITAFTPRHWKNLVTALKIENEVRALEDKNGLNLALEADRWAARDDIISAVAPSVEALAFEDVRHLLDEHGVCWGPYQTFWEAVHEDPRLSEDNPMFQRMSHPERGEYLTPGSVLDFSGFERAEPGLAPIHGEHTEEILFDELSLSQREIGELINQKIVAIGYSKS